MSASVSTRIAKQSQSAFLNKLRLFVQSNTKTDHHPTVQKERISDLYRQSIILPSYDSFIQNPTEATFLDFQR